MKKFLFVIFFLRLRSIWWQTRVIMDFSSALEERLCNYCKNTSFFLWSRKICPSLGSFSVKFHWRLILSFLVSTFLVTKRSKYLKYIFAVPSLRFRSNALKQGWSHIKKAGCIQLFQIIILKWKFLWKNSLLISSHYGQRPQTSVP